MQLLRFYMYLQYSCAAVVVGGELLIIIHIGINRSLIRLSRSVVAAAAAVAAKNKPRANINRILLL